MIILTAITAHVFQPPQSVDYQARLKLAPVFGDHMVLQRGKPAPVWGWSEPGRTIKVSFRGEQVNAIADRTGAWQVELPALQPGGPDELLIEDDADEVLLTDVLVGDVWVCSGQSNMAFPVAKVLDSEQALAESFLPKVRLFKVPFAAHDEPRSVTRGNWAQCLPSTVARFSAVGFFFGKSLNSSEQVPIGLIDASWGGSPAEAWMTRASLYAEPSLKPLLDRYEKARVENNAKIETYRKLRFKPRPNAHRDSVNRGYQLGYASERLNDTDWQEISVPGTWEDNMPGMDIDGAVWYRRTVNVPASFQAVEATLELGQIADYDTVYWNGQRIGGTPTSIDAPGEMKRSYVIPPRLMWSGANVLAVRIFNRSGKGGFVSEEADLRLKSQASTVALPLAGSWKIKVETALSPDNIKPLEIPFGPGHPSAPANLYNGMLAPFSSMGIAGFAWYQGESNVGRAKQYETILQRLITGWRNAFKQGDLPFLIVQLPNFRERTSEPGDAAWAELREAQMKALRLNRVGLAVTIDLGDSEDIHPRNKRAVAERLAEAARQVAYFSTARGLPPIYDGYRVEGSKIRVLFRHTAGSMKTPDGTPIKGFAIAGEDRRWYWAQAQVEGESVLVSSPFVPKPIAVRYAWADNPDCNLVNRTGMPAAPFRTDDWAPMNATY